MIKPQFPFRGNQLILSSDRLILHSKSDAIFLFGDGAVSLSSKQTINLDSNEKVLIDSPKIELGRKAESEGNPIVLGIELTVILLQYLQKMEAASRYLKRVSESNLGDSLQSIATAGQIIEEESSRLIGVLGLTPETNPILSKTTFTT